MFITDVRNRSEYFQVQGSCGTRFSLWGLVLARANPHRLKRVPQSAHTKKTSHNFIQRFGLATAVALSFAALPVTCRQQSTPKTAPAPAPKRDLSGVWHYEGNGGSEPIAPDNLIPPMTPWAQARYDAEKPGYGRKRSPGGNDPILQCDPMGFPRVMFLYTVFEFVQAPGRVIQFFEREHEYRSIWTDGRSLPKDADPTWYGYAVGHWEGDDTFVVDSAGFNDKTWLGSSGYPHSEDMRVIERYHRVDHDTILYDITVIDPKAYARRIVGPHRIMKLRPKDEIVEEICVLSEERSFADRIAAPAVPKPSK
jgi:hypothetical protein